MQTPHFQRKWTIRRVFCYGNEPLWLHASANKDSFYSVRKPVKWTFLFVRGSRLHNMLSSPRYVISAFGFCCKIACSKYELIPLHWNVPNPNKRLAFTVDSSSAPLMDRLFSLFTPCRQKKMRAHEYLPLSKVIPLITQSTLNTVSVATSVAAR